MKDKIEKTYKISGTQEQLLELEKLFVHIEKLGNIGATRNLLVQVDGDGLAHLHFKDEDDLFLSGYIKHLSTDEIDKQEKFTGAVSGIYSLE